MKKLLTGRDIIAIIVITGGLSLKFFGYDGTVSLMLISVVAFYFGLNTDINKPQTK